jgi:hypothetical protein
MSQTAARPWWADVQHLRPDEGGDTEHRATRTGRFDRPSAPSRRPSRGDHPATAREPQQRAAERREPQPQPQQRAAERREPQSQPRAAERRESQSQPRAAERRRSRPEPELWLEPADTPPAQPAERRTIEIRGQAAGVAGVAPVPSAGPQRHRGRRPSERVGPRPDRIAMWAVLLGVLLILVALASSPGADAAALAAGWL